MDSRGKDSLYSVVKEETQAEQALIEEAMFSSVIEGAFSTIARARELIVEGKKPRDTSDQMVLNNGRVMRYVLEQREVIAKYQRDFKVVYETARRDLAQLEARGILTKSKEGRRFIYTLSPAFLTTGVQSNPH